jgi:hypothetical protein
VTTYESVLAILISPINPKVVAVVSITLGGILFYLIFLPSTITMVVIILRGEVSSIYILI